MKKTVGIESATMRSRVNHHEKERKKEGASYREEINTTRNEKESRENTGAAHEDEERDHVFFVGTRDSLCILHGEGEHVRTKGTKGDEPE